MGKAVNPAEASAEPRNLSTPAGEDVQPARELMLWEKVFARDNMKRALQRVERNGRPPGVDGMTVAEMRPWLKAHWLEIRSTLDAGMYRPGASPPGDNSQTRRWNARTGHTDIAGPAYPAGRGASAHAHLRP